jgi:chromate transporter
MTEPVPSKATRLKEVFLLFLWMGFTAFGGPAAHIAIFHDQVVKRRKWIDEQHFLDLLGATQLIPGPNSTEVTIYLGFYRAGWLGLILGGVGFILPSTLIVLGLAWTYGRFGSAPQIEWVLYAVKPVVIAIIINALWSLRKNAIKDISTGLIAVTVIALNFFGIDTIALLIGSGILLAVYLWMKNHLKDTRSLWLFLPFGSTVTLQQAVHSFSLPALFLTFLKIGSVLYGSGYVLLAFLRSEFVINLGWLTDQQIIDAVAIGQVTPGPLSTAATFLGFILGGIPGALLATLGMFLPSFLIVILTKPFIPRMRESKFFSAFLDGVNAGSLGLMAVVAWQLARAAFVDIPAVLLGIVSFLLVVWARVNSTWIILGAVLVGLGRYLFSI